MIGYVRIKRETLVNAAAQLRQLSDELVALAGQEPEDIPEDDLVAPGEVSADVLFLARAIQGEGSALFGDYRDEIGLWIGHTAMNRMAKPWWPDSMVEIVSGAFHGYVNVLNPARWAVRLAKQTMERDEDITGGALFMLSGKDLKEHGWSGSEAHQAFVNNDHEMYFFRTWPGD